MTTAPAPAADPDFESDLFNVCDDSGACLKGFFCPCWLVGQIHEKMGHNHWAFCCLSLLGNNLGLACARRGMIRHAFNLHYTPCGDCLAVTCCGPCAAIQEYNQVSKKTYPIRSDINEWGTGLFDCMDDSYMCRKGAFCPCMVSADALAEMGAPWICICMCPIGCAARTLIRESYNIPGSFYKDCLTYCLCYPCAACQEARFMHKASNPTPASPSSPPSAPGRM